MATEIQDIWNEFYNELKSYVTKIIHNEMDTDDIMQEVFVKVIHNIDKIKKSTNLQQYLYAIVRNTLFDYQRKYSQSSDCYIPETLENEEYQSLNPIISDRLKTFIDMLPEKYREALIYSEIRGLSQKALAAKLNISYSGAKSRVQRGREKLKEQLLACCAFEHDKYGNIMDVEKK
ncbi:MAG: RNA polymerase sigma factor SigZ [Parabacteroides sp.]